MQQLAAVVLIAQKLQACLIGHRGDHPQHGAILDDHKIVARLLQVVQGLCRVRIDGGRVSPHLPIRFAGEAVNGNEDLALVRLDFEFYGRRIEKPTRVEPESSRRFSLQFLFPEDPEFGEVDPDEVEWTLVGALGEAP